MRTSLRIFLGSIGMLGIGLLIYDLQLNAAFRKNDYTRPFYDYVPLDFRGFDSIRLNSTNTVKFLLVHGDFKVMVNPRIKDWLKIRQEGSRLIVTVDFPDRLDGFPQDYALYLSCPTLSELETSGHYFVRGEERVDSLGVSFWQQPTVVSGFQLDSLKISEQAGGDLDLGRNRIGALRAAVGSGSALTIEPSNVIGGGDISVLSNGQLTLKDSNNLKINNHFSDGAKLILTGPAVRRLLKLNQP